MPVDARLLLQSQPTPSVAQNMADVFGLKGIQQQQQIEGFKLQQMQEAAAAQKALDAAVLGSNSDEDVLSRIRQTPGLGHLLPDIQKKFSDADKSRGEALKVKGDVAQHRLDYAGSLAASVLSLPEEAQEQAYVEALGKGVRDGIWSRDDAVQHLQQVATGGPDALKQQLTAAVQGSTKQREVAAREATAKRTAAGPQPTAYAQALARRDAYEADPEHFPAPPPGDKYLIQAHENEQEGKGSQAVKEKIQVQRLMEQDKAAKRGDPNAKPLTPAEIDRVETWKDLQRSGASSLPDEDIDTLADMLRTNNATVAQMSKRQDYGRILARANRRSMELDGKPFSPAQQAIEFEGAKKFILSLNSEHNLTFNRLANSAKQQLEIVKGLADELQQGGVQKFNQMKRGTIRQVWGNSPQSGLAVQYETALAALESEVAQLESGGYAPQTAGFALAQRQFNPDYGAKDMMASLAQVEKVINARLQAQTEQRSLTPGGRTNTFSPQGGRSPLRGGTTGGARDGAGIR